MEMQTQTLSMHTYTRRQAIGDGMLVDVTEAAAIAGSRIPVSLTPAAWADCVAWGELDSRRHKVHQDEAGRLRDVLTMAVYACRRQQGNDVARFYLSRIPRLGRGRYVELIARIGAGAQGKPVATIMLAGED